LDSEPELVQEPKPELEREPKRSQEPESGGELEPALVEAEPAAAERPPEQPRRPTLEPLRPRPTRRWFRRRVEAPPEAVEPEPLPKHVRLLPTAARPDRVSDEVAEIFDVSDREHRG
jgi:hypothetical protein